MQSRDPSMPAGDMEPGAEPHEAGGMGDGVSHFVAGIIFVLVGVAALLIGSGYAMGSSVNMGAGYFPRMIAGGLVVLGLLIAAKGWMSADWQIQGFVLQPLVTILAAILVFGLGIERLGLFAVCLVTAVIAASAQPVVNWRRVALIALLMASFCSVLFGYLLNLSLPVWPG